MQVTLCRCPLSKGATVYTPSAQFLFRVWALMYTCHHQHKGGSELPLLLWAVVESEGRDRRCGEVGMLCSAQVGWRRPESFSYPFLLHSLSLQSLKCYVVSFACIGVDYQSSSLLAMFLQLRQHCAPAHSNLASRYDITITDSSTGNWDSRSKDSNTWILL